MITVYGRCCKSRRGPFQFICPQGQRGSQIYFGINNPISGSQYNNGDVFINTTTFDVFSYQSGIWILEGNLKGSQGAPGSQIYFNPANPSTTVGFNNGDVWINTTTFDVFSLQAGVWVLEGNIKGPPGSGCIPPLPNITRIIYVNQGGNDSTADGSLCKPYLTITAAMASITTAIAPSPDPNNLTKRYEINIGPGQYNEGQLGLKANVQLVGESILLTRLNIPFILDPSDVNWNDLNFSKDPRSGFVQLTLLQPLNLNFRIVQSVSGKLFFDSVTTGGNSTLILTALSTSVNQVNIRNSQLGAGYTQNGINMNIFSSFVSGGNIVINSQVDTDTQVNLVGGGINGNIIINVQSGHIPIDPLNLTSFAIAENIFNPFPNSGQLIINGVNNVSTRVRATVDSIPIRQRVIIVGTSTSLIRVDDSNGLAYTPINSANWNSPSPTTVQEALDRLASRVALLGPPLP